MWISAVIAAVIAAVVYWNSSEWELAQKIGIIGGAFGLGIPVGILLWRILRPLLKVLVGRGVQKIEPLPFHKTEKAKTESEQFFYDYNLTRCPMCGHKIHNDDVKVDGEVYRQTTTEWFFKDTGEHAWTTHGKESAGGKSVERNCHCDTCGLRYDQYYTVEAEWQSKKDLAGEFIGGAYVEHHKMTYVPRTEIDEVAKRIFDEHSAQKDIQTSA
jgi:hypothetical protein